MSAAKMTPGPWHIEETLDERCNVVGAGATNVAYVWASDLADGAANARAIACLPELIDAAREALDDYEHTHEDDLNCSDCRLRRIIGRIDGEGGDK